jgi:hypothetical protein
MKIAKQNNYITDYFGCFIFLFIVNTATAATTTTTITTHGRVQMGRGPIKCYSLGATTCLNLAQVRGYL